MDMFVINIGGNSFIFHPYDFFRLFFLPFNMPFVLDIRSNGIQMFHVEHFFQFFRQ